MSEPLYSSSFQAKELNKLTSNGNLKATNNTLMDFYAHRYQNERLQPIIETITYFYDFVSQSKVVKGQLTKRHHNKQIIIVTYPKVRYNPQIYEAYIDYCYYQTIKYSNWDIADLELLKNKSTAVERFENFYRNASDELRETIR